MGEVINQRAAWAARVDSSRFSESGGAWAFSRLEGGRSRAGSGGGQERGAVGRGRASRNRIGAVATGQTL